MGRLNILYEELDFRNGSLYSVTDIPTSSLASTDWLEKGEWLAAAKRAGAEKIFFVENNPVAVFVKCGEEIEEKVKAFNRVWSLARPRLLFLASPGEIAVFDLAQRPVDESKPEEWKNLKNLDVLYDLKEAAQKLQAYHRDHVESGRVFADKRFGDLKNRADKALIRDLKTVRRELIHAGLFGERVRYAHALIGRSIFIRYLEDRGILTQGYFLDVARRKADWADLLSRPDKKTEFASSHQETYYPRILADKAFTYALFKRLARDFNGDMFPGIEEEEQVVNRKHLGLIQDLLYGDVGTQKNLFFFSYRFDIIPLDLISSIYEEFYYLTADEDEKNSKKRQDGAYYTPPVLVEFVLSRILTPDVLDTTPRILDPACGSGIFLVEAFRRMVRYERHKSGKYLSFAMLKRILKEQIAGIEVNEKTARVTAFSLYLSLLHYLEPPAIDRHIKIGNTLPNLVAADKRSENHFHCILPLDAFDPEKIETNPIWQDRFGKGCADIIVGNPPWGAPGKKADIETKARHKKLVDWCKTNNKPIGDKEPSQAFLWRALDFLKENGKTGMLVSAGVLFKHNTTSQAFRNHWLKLVRLDEVFNFSHVRKFFFKGANSPFLLINFSKGDQKDSSIHYWAAKQTININKMQSILLSKYDMQILCSEDTSASTTWKTFWFGRHADASLIHFFSRRKRLHFFSDREKCGRGYDASSEHKNADVLQFFRKMEISSFSRYDSFRFSIPPKKVSRLGAISEYDGNRILVKRGIQEKTADKGRIIARYETEPFCFTNAIHGIKLSSPEEWKYKTILGILWSSAARYFFFMTASNWGLWHHEIHHDDELLQLPVVLNESNPATKKIIAIVDKLRDYHPQKRDIFCPDGVPGEEIDAWRRQWEAELDEAVFELYGLSEEQIDLIRDFCNVTLPFYYKPFNSIGAKKALEENDFAWIEKYAHTFSRRWNAYLGEDEEMRAEVHVGAHGNMAAVEFFPSGKNTPWKLEPKDNSWDYILEKIGKALLQPMGTSQILLDGLVHVVSDNGIIIIKRNEKRFWTRSLAREDADATICKRMAGAMPKEGRDNT
jgi:type I restriction-modification system DNA methylase subunit